jgi:hypothetical protein
MTQPPPTKYATKPFSSFTPTNMAEKELFSKKNTKTMSQVLLFRT